MRMNLQTEGLYLGTSAQEGKDRMYYNVAIMCGSEAGTISATEEVYCDCMSGKIAQFTHCKFGCVFNDTYKHLQVVSIDTID